MSLSRRQVLGALLAIPGAVAAVAEERQPTMPDEINPFSTAFNCYVAELREGKVDVPGWKRVRHAWGRMIGA